MNFNKLTICFAILFFAFISTAMLASATIYPTYDNATDCRGCHGSDVSDRHHLLVVNGTYQCTDCHPVQFDNVTQTYSTQIIRNCLICHPGKNHNGVHHILASQGLFVCSDCHPMKYDNVTQTYYPFVTWDCTVCHSTVLSIQNVVPTPTPTPTPVPTPTVQIAKITNFTPASPVANFVGDSRSFHIIIDQVADVTWTINGTPVQSNGGVTDAGYTNTNATLGTWIVNATASNANGNVTYSWEWIVTTPPPPPTVPFITSNFPLYSSVNDSVGSSRKFGISTGQNVSIQWLINGNQVQLDGNVNASSYNNTSAVQGIWNVSAVASNINGTVIYSWIWNVYPPPTITSSSPISPVNDTYGTPRIFNITTDQIVNVTWYINGTPIQSNDSITDALYNNMSASPGTWNVSAVVTNDNGSTMNSWVWNVISIPPLPPVIISYSPTQFPNDTAEASRTFNITINQAANVAWYINGTQVNSNTGITDANYTNTSAWAGTWNISAIVTNPNGSTMNTWIWNVAQTPPSPPGIVGFSPISPVNDITGASRIFNITTDQIVNITWYINGTPILSNNGVTIAGYTNTSASPGTWNISAIVTNPNGSTMNTWIWNVYPPPVITSSSPISPVNDITGASRIFNITTDQIVNITWYINGTPILSNNGVTIAGYTNTSASPGAWNISAIATNGNGSVMNSWIWKVAPIVPSPPGIISFAPASPVNDTVGITRMFNITINQTANVTWYINNSPVQYNNGITNANYINASTKLGTWNISAIVINANGSAMKSWTWNVVPVYPPPGIVSYSPISPVNDTEGSSRTFNITTNQTTNVIWYINNSTVQSDNGVINSSYTNASASPGKWIVKVVATNPNGNVTRSWTWNVTPIPKPVTTIDPPNGKNGWYVNNTIYINATDSNGIKYTSYSINGSAWISHQGIGATANISAISPIAVHYIRYPIYSINLKTPVVLSDGVYTIQYYSVNNLNGTESTKTQTVRIDTTPPKITINFPINGSVYILNQNLIANWSVNDTTSGTALAIATYANGSVISTSSIGTKSFSVNDSDNAGNTNKTNITYYIRYNFGGFLQPIDMNGSSIFKQGSKIDIRFRLSDSKLMNIATATAQLTFSLVNATIVGRDLKPYSYDTASVGGAFKYDSKNMWYYYNLDSKGLATGTWQIRADINDGSSYVVNISLQN